MKICPTFGADMGLVGCGRLSNIGGERRVFNMDLRNTELPNVYLEKSTDVVGGWRKKGEKVHIGAVRE